MGPWKSQVSEALTSREQRFETHRVVASDAVEAKQEELGQAVDHGTVNFLRRVQAELCGISVVQEL